MDRFPLALGIINATVKVGKVSCEVPVNKLVLNVLRLLRGQGIIWGFNFTSPKLRRNRLYPRVIIHFKYIDSTSPMLRRIRVFPKTYSNFHILKNIQMNKVLAQHKRYVITTPGGLILTSPDNVSKARSKMIRFAGKVLAEIFI